MLDDTDDPLKDGPQAPRPVIVVQVRRGLMSRLVVPALVLIAAGAVLSHRMRVDDWRGLSAFFPEEEPVVEPGPVVRAPVAIAPAPTVMQAAPAKTRAPRVIPRPMPLRHSSGRASVAAIPFPDRAKKVAEAWADIRRDVEKAKANAVVMEDLKKSVFEEEQRLQPIREAAAAVQAEDTRVTFRKDLSRALARPDKERGLAVESVCQDYGLRIYLERASGTEWEAETHSAGRRNRVERLRASGVSETDILGDLARLEARNRVARGGPKTRQDVLVRAARQLLAVPLRRG